LTLIRFDECISWRIVDALLALRLPDGIELETPKHREENGVADINWITDFASRGGKLVVSGDARMRNVQLERAALEASGLIAVFPSSKKYFDSLGKWGQAGYLTTWFPSIVQLSLEAEPGSHYRIPDSFSGKFDSLILMRSLADIEEEAATKAAARQRRDPEQN
jgi:hypothetical protein